MNQQHLLQQQQGPTLNRGVSLSPQILEPDFVISGGPSIKQYHILNDKRHILTKDTDSHVALYDVLKAQRVEDLGKVDFEQETKNRCQVENDMVFSIYFFSTEIVFKDPKAYYTKFFKPLLDRICS